MTIGFFNGGNCTWEEHETYRREFADITGWDGSLPSDPDPFELMPEPHRANLQQTRVLDRVRPRLLGSPPRVVCPRCLGPMVEAPGFDDFCPPCRQREELQLERAVVLVEVARLTHWFEGGSDVH